MVHFMRFLMAVAVMLGFISGALGTMEDTERNNLGIPFSYGRGLDSELQLARLLMLPQHICHPKRNSELINSLLGLPKNMNNAGK